jgi:hypothetical protein
MQVQTDVKAGFGLLCLDIDLELDIDLNLFGCGSCGRRKHYGKC